MCDLSRGEGDNLNYHKEGEGYLKGSVLILITVIDVKNVEGQMITR